MKKKITLMGAGQIGGTLAHLIALKGLANVVLFDVAEGIAKGKALDIAQASPVEGFNVNLKGTNSYADTKDSDVIIITAGVPRKPGMSRDDLIGTNAKIVKTVTENIIKYSPDCIIIIVSNPLDVMTYQAHLTSKFPREKIMGMAGILDTARFRAFIADELNISTKDIQALLLGGHGDTMVPLPRYTTVSGIPVTELIDDKKLDAIIERTKFGGGELVKLMGTSAWYAPGSAAAQMVEAIIKDQKRIFPVCTKLSGEYGIDDCYLGVPVVLGSNGIEKVIQLKLNDDEMNLLEESRLHVKEVMSVLDNL